MIPNPVLVWIIYIGDQIQFTDLSTNSPDSWYWDFGDQSTSTLQNPFHIYQVCGNYNVTLIVSNQFGSDELTKEDYISVYDPDDDFEDGRINDLWKFIQGNWQEENVYLEQISNTGSEDDFREGCFALTGTDSWQNYEIRAEIMNITNGGIGLVLNFQDQDNFY